MMKPTCTLFIFLLAFIAPAFAVDKYILAVDDWDRPHDVNSVSTLQPLPAVVKKWSSKPDQTIDIRYPGGEVGQLLANRLQDWLVILGIPSSAIELTPGSAAVTQLELVIQ